MNPTHKPPQLPGPRSHSSPRLDGLEELLVLGIVIAEQRAVFDRESVPPKGKVSNRLKKRFQTRIEQSFAMRNEATYCLWPRLLIKRCRGHARWT